MVHEAMQEVAGENYTLGLCTWGVSHPDLRRARDGPAAQGSVLPFLIPEAVTECDHTAPLCPGSGMAFWGLQAII